MMAPTKSVVEGESVSLQLQRQMKVKLEASFMAAEKLVKEGNFQDLTSRLGERGFAAAKELGKIRHAARGVALTLVAYKSTNSDQDVRRHQSGHSNGFSARTFDTQVTVPFLASHGLNYNVETHWLSQTFSFAGPYELSVPLVTQPKRAGQLLLELLDVIQGPGDSADLAVAAMQVLLVGLIEERNKSKVLLTKPKDLTIDQVIGLLQAHFSLKYEKNAPRLPQIAIYAIYMCITAAMDRYDGLELAPLERMKTANRKSGTVGDVDVNRLGKPVEAVEIKFGVPINRSHVGEAIQKIKTATVERYLMLSTVGIHGEDSDEIKKLQSDFKKMNGCEIIVNGVFETIKYYLRLLKSTNDFVNEYTSLVEKDPDLGYEQRVGWNDVCAKRFGDQ